MFGAKLVAATGRRISGVDGALGACPVFRMFIINNIITCSW